MRTEVFCQQRQVLTQENLFSIRLFNYKRLYWGMCPQPFTLLQKEQKERKWLTKAAAH